VVLRFRLRFTSAFVRLRRDSRRDKLLLRPAQPRRLSRDKRSKHRNTRFLTFLACFPPKPLSRHDLTAHKNHFPVRGNDFSAYKNDFYTPGNEVSAR
jgi:hypothetical protein